MPHTTRPTRHIFEAVARRLLIESLGDGLAVAVTRPLSSRLAAVIYDPGALAPNLDRILDPATPGTTYKEILARTAIRGIIRLADTRHPCNGAWEVTTSAGPGIGKIVYGVGYALAPNGRIMPDRLSVSDAARDAWETQFHKGRPKWKLDDVDNPATPPPEDDCAVHLPFLQSDEEEQWKEQLRRSAKARRTGGTPVEAPEGDFYLDYAYGPEGWEAGLLARLEAAHQQFLDTLDPQGRRTFVARLPEAIGNFFKIHYDG